MLKRYQKPFKSDEPLPVDEDDEIVNGPNYMALAVFLLVPIIVLVVLLAGIYFAATAWLAAPDETREFGRLPSLIAAPSTPT